MTRTGLTLALALTAIALVAAPAAQGSHVQCGQVITQDTRLDSDLIDCPGDGVVIGADGITLDLRGHSIIGPGEDGFAAQGVDDSAGYDGLTVQGGEIRHFLQGTYLVGTDRARVRQMTLTDNGAGVQIDHGDGNVIDHNVFSSTSANSGGVRIFDGSDDNAIMANSFAGTGNGVLLWGAANTGQIYRTRVESNTLTRNGVGVLAFLGTVQTLIAGNRVSGSTDFAIGAVGDSTLVDRNSLSDNRLGVFVSGPHTLVSKNRVTGSATDGINVSSSTTAVDTVVDRNVTSGNGDDGIDIDRCESPSSTCTHPAFDRTVSRNIANGNGDLGIEAAPGTTDGGGNKARGNGNSAQCLNVSCK